MELTVVKVPVGELRFKWQRHGESKETVDVPILLVASIVNHGIINPLLITEVDGQYYVWLGNQRLVVARQVGIEEVDCIVVNSSAEVKEAFDSYQEA